MAVSCGSNQTYKVVVWEWLNDLILWEPYEPAVVDFIEKQYQLRSSFSLTAQFPKTFPSHEIKFSSSSSKEADESSRGFQRNLKTDTKRVIRRHLVSSADAGGIAEGVFWKWQGDNRQRPWNFYPTEVSQKIEVAKRDYDQRLANAMINLETTFPFPYTVDVANFQQVKNSSGFVRVIKREITVHFPRVQDSSVKSVSTEQSLLLPTKVKAIPANPRNEAPPARSSTDAAEGRSTSIAPSQTVGKTRPSTRALSGVPVRTQSGALAFSKETSSSAILARKENPTLPSVKPLVKAAVQTAPLSVYPETKLSVTPTSTGQSAKIVEAPNSAIFAAPSAMTPKVSPIPDVQIVPASASTNFNDNASARPTVVIPSSRDVKEKPLDYSLSKELSVRPKAAARGSEVVGPFPKAPPSLDAEGGTRDHVEDPNLLRECRYREHEEVNDCASYFRKVHACHGRA